MVGCSEVSPQGKRAGAFAVVGIIAPGRDDPTRPADLLKVNEERNPLAGLGLTLGRGTSSPAVVVMVLRRSYCWLGLAYLKEVDETFWLHSHEDTYFSPTEHAHITVTSLFIICQLE